MKKNNQYYFKLFICIFLCWVNGFSILSALAQHRLTILVKNNSVTSPSDSIYAAGEFNNWNPASSSFLFSKTKDGFSLVVEDIKPGAYSFKITKGSWQRVECNANGTNISNREILINTDTTIVCEVLAWRAGDVKSFLVSTASINVQILDTAFEIPQLNRKRTIRIYLPEGYKNLTKKFPVLYMQDGQNLFDEATGAFGEWGVDESLDSLEKAKRATCIVVGIENSSYRLTEYNPFYF
ncbi:MAG: alpha/beta hydrolase-fold protein [Ferruginibacter sp.]